MRYKVKVSTSMAMAYEPNDTVDSTGRAKNTQAHTHLLQQSNKKKRRKKKQKQVQRGHSSRACTRISLSLLNQFYATQGNSVMSFFCAISAQ